MAKESSEIIFIDATSNCDQQNIAVVPVLCPSASGALPLAMAFCSSQDEDMFTRGNSILFLSKKRFVLIKARSRTLQMYP